MRSTAIGVLLATLAMYVWGMLYWGANPAPYTAWQQTRDDAAAGRAILQHFPVSGTHYLPGLYNDAETRTKLHEHYGDRVKLAAVAGLLAALLVPGLVLARFIERGERETA